MARLLGDSAGSNLPPLREDLLLYEVAPQIDGSPTWTIQDPVTNTFLAIGWLEFELLSRWHLGNKEKVIRATNVETPLEVEPEEIDHLVDVLTKSKFFDVHGYEQTDALLDQERQAQTSFVNYLLHQYLFFRVPIWHPDEWLKRLYPAVSFVYSKAMLIALSIAAVFAFYLTVQKIDIFAANFVDTFTLEGVIGYLIALVFTKTLHELGHAFTATRYGVRVAHMGVAFVVMWPMLYTDTGETWRVKRSEHRLAIAAAGVSAELALAVIALLAWNLTSPSPLQDALFFLATTAWVITLAINISPFLRFDGYYILSDILDIPNLHERSTDAKKVWLRRNLLGWDVEYSEDLSARRKFFFIVFSTLAWLYRMVVFLGIAAAVYFFFFKALGIFLALVEIWWFVLKPMFAEMTLWRENWSQTKAANKTGVITGLALLILVLALPWQSRILVPGWIHAGEASAIYAAEPGRLIAIPEASGYKQEGESLFILSQPQTLASIQLAVAAKASIEEQLQGLMGVAGGESLRLELVETWREHDATEKAERAKLEKLNIIAPFSGYLTDIDPTLAEGAWVNPEQPLAVIMNTQGWIVDAYVTQQDYQRINIGAEVEFFTAQNPLTPLKGKVVSIDGKRVETLPEPLLSARYGGALSVENDQNGLTPRDTLFKIRIRMNEHPLNEQVSVGNARITAEPKSLLESMFNAVAVILVREMSF